MVNLDSLAVFCGFHVAGVSPDIQGNVGVAWRSSLRRRASVW